MPNQPRADNPVRYIRVEDALWQRAQARADRETVETGARVTVSAVVRDALEAYTADDADTLDDARAEALRGAAADVLLGSDGPFYGTQVADYLNARARRYARADRDGVKVSAVVRAALEEYTKTREDAP